MPKVLKKKNPRRKSSMEKELESKVQTYDSMSAEQINIITPNGPTFDQEGIEKHNSSLHSMSERAHHTPGEI